IGATNESQTLTLVANGTINLSLAPLGTSTAPLSVVTSGASVTTLANVLASLNALPGQNGNFAVTGSAPTFTIQFIGGLANTNVNQLATNNTAVATAATLTDGPTSAAQIQNNLASIPTLGSDETQ